MSPGVILHRSFVFFIGTGTEMVEVQKVLKGDPELYEIEEEFRKWQEKSLEAYQSQVMCMRKLQQEILQLKSVVSEIYFSLHSSF